MRNQISIILIAIGAMAWAVRVQDDGHPVVPAAIAPAQALEKIGESQVRVVMTVKHAKDRLFKRGILFLDSEEDFMHPANLGVAVAPSAANELQSQGVTDLEAHFLGKTIEVTGCLMRFEERPYLPVLRLDQIRIVENK